MPGTANTALVVASGKQPPEMAHDEEDGGQKQTERALVNHALNHVCLHKPVTSGQSMSVKGAVELSTGW